MIKKGQATIFIIVAIVIIAITAMFFVFKDNILSKNTSLNIEPFNTKIISCLETTSEEGIRYIALQGGYYSIPKEFYFSYIAEDTSYYYLNSKKNLPSFERIENELRDYIYDRLESCMNIDNFREQGFNISEGELIVSVSIKGYEIRTDIDYPITFTKGENTYRLKDFKSEIVFNIEKVYLASGEIVDSYSRKTGFVCLDCLEEISGKYGVEIRATPIQKEVIWFSILDNENELKWRFVVEQ